MKPTRTLPAGYHLARTVDITRSPALMLWLNLLGLVISALAGWAFFRAAVWLYPAESSRILSIALQSTPEMLILLAAVLGLTAFNLILHEAIHGACFWWFTRARPIFAIRLTHAYAAAPDWYLPRGAYLVTGLAPLVLISAGMLALMALGGPGWLTAAWFVATINAGGAVGDIAVAVWLLSLSASCLAQDRGDAVSLFVAG